MADLFDLVKAAPPPDKVRASPKRAVVSPPLSRAGSLPPPASSPAQPSAPLASSPCWLPSEPSAPLASSPLLDDLPKGTVTVTRTVTVTYIQQAVVLVKRLSLQEGSNSNSNETLDSNLDSSSQNARSCLTKTKAQQKQFDDELPRKNNDGANVTTDQLKNDGASIRPLCVRVKRLSQAEIDEKTQPTKPKRGRPKQSLKLEDSFSLPTVSRSSTIPLSGKKRKLHSGDSCPTAAAEAEAEALSSPAKKLAKSVPQFHFNLTQHKSLNSGTKRLRTSTPTPPSSPTLRNRKALIERYGGRVFRSYVPMKRCKILVGLASQERGRKSRRPNLSVSFRDAVEIIGPSSDSVKSVPTRLTKVENGRVVQQVALDQLTSPTARSTKLRVEKKHRKKREASDKMTGSRRSSKTSRFSADRLPVGDMSRLRINDDADIVVIEDDDEYIVPNEPPLDVSSIKDIPINVATNEIEETKNELKSSSVSLKSTSPSSIAAPSPPPALSSSAAPSSPTGPTSPVRPSSPRRASLEVRPLTPPGLSEDIRPSSPPCSSTKVRSPSPSSSSLKIRTPSPSSIVVSPKPSQDEETSLPNILESRAQESPNERCDDIVTNSEELTQVATKGPTPRRALKSVAPPSGELEDKDEVIGQDGESQTNAAVNTNISLTLTRHKTADGKSTPLIQKADKLRSPSVESESSFCSAQDDVEQTNGEKNQATKLKSASPDAKETEIEIKEEVQSDGETDAIIDETEGQTEPESLDKTKYMDKDDDSKLNLTMPDETFRLVAEYSSDDGDSEPAIKKPNALPDTVEKRGNTDDEIAEEIEAGAEAEAAAIQPNSCVVDDDGNDDIATAADEVAKPRSSREVRETPTPNIIDEKSQESKIEIGLLEDEDDQEDLRVNIRKQEDDLRDNLNM